MEKNTWMKLYGNWEENGFFDSCLHTGENQMLLRGISHQTQWRLEGTVYTHTHTPHTPNPRQLLRNLFTPINRCELVLHRTRADFLHLFQNNPANGIISGVCWGKITIIQTLARNHLCYNCEWYLKSCGLLREVCYYLCKWLDLIGPESPFTSTVQYIERKISNWCLDG